MNNSLNLQMAVSCGSMEAYFEAVGRIPILCADEERMLAERYRMGDDLDAARELVMSHLRFVVRIARGYNGYGLAQADLIQEGNIGLMKAVKRFDPDVGVRLVSFAVHWIRAEMHEFILRNWRIVKVATTKPQRKLFFNLRSSKKRLAWLNNEEAAAIAKDLGVTTQEVLRMEERLSARDCAFDPVGEPREDGPMVAPSAYLEDLRFEPARLVEAEQLRESGQTLLAAALADLDPRSREIIKCRWLAEHKVTLKVLAEKFGISAERIRQLEKRALEKLREALGTEMALLPAPSW